MLKIIMNRLKPQAEKTIAEEQAGFKAGRGTTEQIFNLRILCEKYLQHQQDLYHVVIAFKKAFDRVWHAVLWATMRKYNNSANLIRVIKNLCDRATSATLSNSATGDWFRTTVGARQECLLSPTLFNIYLKRIITDALEDHEELQKRIQAMEMRCYRKILCVSYKDNVINEEVPVKIQQAVGPDEDLTIVKRRKLQGMVMYPVHQVWPIPSCKTQ